MPMRPLPAAPVSEATARVAQAAFPHGCLAMRVRDELGAVFEENAAFVEAFARQDGPSYRRGCWHWSACCSMRNVRPIGRRWTRCGLGSTGNTASAWS